MRGSYSWGGTISSADNVSLWKSHCWSREKMGIKHSSSFGEAEVSRHSRNGKLLSSRETRSHKNTFCAPHFPKIFLSQIMPMPGDSAQEYLCSLLLSYWIKTLKPSLKSVVSQSFLPRSCKKGVRLQFSTGMCSKNIIPTFCKVYTVRL